MEYLGPSVFWLVQTLAVVLFVMGAFAFSALLQGSFVLRRRNLLGGHHYGDTLLKSPMVPAVSTIAVPADASAETLQFTRRLLDLTFGRNELVIVLDGPSPEDLAIWIREYNLVKSARAYESKLAMVTVRGIYESRDPIRVVVVDKERGGIADAWNAAVNVATSPVIGILEADSEFEPTVLLRMIQPMLEDPDGTVAVVGGDPIPPGDSRVSRYAALESLRAWLTRGAAYSGRNLVLPIPGSAVLARRSSVIASGGFTGGSLELILRLHALCLVSNQPYRVAFLPGPLSYEKAPQSSAELRALVRRDQTEIGNAIRKRTAVAGPYGWKMLSGLYYDRSVRPKLEFLTYLLTIVGLAGGWVDLYLAGFVLVSTVLMGMVQSMAAVTFREMSQPSRLSPGEVKSLFFAAIPENLGYRQIRSLWLLSGK